MVTVVMCSTVSFTVHVMSEQFISVANCRGDVRLVLPNPSGSGLTKSVRLYLAKDGLKKRHGSHAEELRFQACK